MSPGNPAKTGHTASLKEFTDWLYQQSNIIVGLGIHSRYQPIDIKM